MNKQREAYIGWKVPAPVDDELLGTRVEISLPKWGWIDGVEELAQLGDADLDHSGFRRDRVPSGW